MINIRGGPPARRALALLTTLILTAGALAAGAPAQAAEAQAGEAPASRPQFGAGQADPVDPDNPDNLPTYVRCVGGANKGRMNAVVPVGPGRVLVLGWARPCRPPKATDSAVIADMNADFGGLAGVVYYRRTIRGYFAQVVTLSATTKRVCLADTPRSATDCYAVDVPQRNGKLGVPVVRGRTTTARIEIPGSIGFCGSCW